MLDTCTKMYPHTDNTKNGGEEALYESASEKSMFKWATCSLLGK